MKKRILKAIVAMSLIISLTMANFILLGVNAVSYAMGELNQTSETNSKNIKFTTYFKTDTNQKTEIKEEKITSQDMKLYMEISVQDGGYFNGEIEILNSNFTIKDQELSEKINKIDGNKVSLNQINDGETVEIELKIIPKQGDIIDSSLLDMESQVRLSGIYTDSNAKKVAIEATKNVQLILEDPYEENKGAILKTEVITNKIYKINNEEKRLVQIKVESGLEGNKYPVKSTNIELSVPELVEDVKVISLGTNATNGKEEKQFTVDNWKYIKEENKVNITIENNGQDGKITWNKGVTDTFVITYILPNNVEVTNTEINVKDKIELYNSKQTVKETVNTIKIEEEKDGIHEIESSNNEENIYKGKIYAKQDREYVTNVDLYVNYSEMSDAIQITENQSTYKTENNELTANVQYKTTKINKAKMTEVLGNLGTIEILDQNGKAVATLTNATQTDEDGNIVVKYEEGVKSVTIKTSAPVTTGKIEVEHTKVVKAEGYSIEEIKQFKSIKQEIFSMYNGITITNSSEINLQETMTKAKFEINRKELSAIASNENVEIKATLITNGEKYDLYKNPTIKIELPSQVENINVNSINLLYEDELKVNSAGLYEENGIKIIEVKLQGEQTKYIDNLVAEGATVIINSNIVISKTATSGAEKIKMTYTNEKATAYESDILEQDIEIVAPTEMVVVNTMADLSLSAIGEEETQTKLIEVGNEAKQEEVKISVINNTGAEAENVTILGSFPTQDDENTMQTTITNAIQTQGVDESKVTVYYSQNPNATADLTAENGWEEEITNGQEVQSYLISVASLDEGESLIAAYGLEIPEDLGYNEKAYQGYTLTYSNTLTGQEETVQATTLGVSTGVGPELKATLTASVSGEKLANGDKVAGGEIIKYKVKIENVGTEDATNVVLTENVPDGTYIAQYVDVIEEKENYEEVREGCGIKRTYESTSKTIDSIPAGKYIEEEYEVKVNETIKKDTNITNKLTVNYNEISIESNELTVVAETADILLDIYEGTIDNRDNLNLIAGNGTNVALLITNNTDQDKENVKVNIINDEQLTISDIRAKDEDEINLENKTINIKSIEKGASIFVDICIFAIEELGDTTNPSIYAKVTSDNVTYRSNKLTYQIKQKSLQIKQTSDTAGKYVKDGDKINYTITLKNDGEVDLSGISFKDEIPSILTVLSVEQDGKIIKQFSKEGTTINEIDNFLTLSGINLKQGEETVIKISALIEKGTQTDKSIKISNIATANYGAKTIKSEEITHLIEALSQENNESGDTSTENNGNANSTSTYNISGTAWLDTDKDGIIDQNEKLFENITVELVDIETNKIVKNSSGKQIKTTTDSKGFYSLEKVPKGKYIVAFEFDTTKYIPTSYKVNGIEESKNSKVVLNTLKINGQEKTVANTDTITIDNKSIPNINIGLKEIESFSLKLDKYVSKIITQTSSETKTYEYDNTTFAKIELPSKQMKNTNIIIEYEIKITNIGDAEGYARNVVDYMPSGMKFSSELNTDWYQKNSNLYNKSLVNEKILPGETKTLKLVLTKMVTSESSEIVNNTAEIAESYSASGLQDTNSTSGNKVQGEIDMGSADIVITISTGEKILNIALISTMILIIIGAGIYFINKKVIKLKM